MLFKILKNSLPILLLLSFLGLPTAHAEDFQCEVMSIDGSAYVTNSSVTHQILKEGDILKADDLVEVGSDSAVDIAYDKDWQNVTRLEENSKVEIKSIFPTTLKMAYGGIYAKLKALPKDSTFEVETPTALAAVRGTEYRTVHQDEGTQVFNLSESQVFVFGQDESGKFSETPTIVEHSEATQIVKPGAPPIAPRKMEDREIQKFMQRKEGVEKRIKQNIERGRVGKLQDIHVIEKMHQERVQANGQQGRGSLVSLPGQQGDPQSKEAMRREDRMLKMMNSAQVSQREGSDRMNEGQRDGQFQGASQGNFGDRQASGNNGNGPGGDRPDNRRMDQQNSSGDDRQFNDRQNQPGLPFDRRKDGNSFVNREGGSVNGNGPQADGEQGGPGGPSNQNQKKPGPQGRKQAPPKPRQ